MIQIYKYDEIADTYFVKEGSKVVRFDTKNKTIERGSGLRILLFFLNHSVTQLKRDTVQYNKVADLYANFLGDLPVRYCNDFKVHKSGNDKKKEQEKYLRMEPHRDRGCA